MVIYTQNVYELDFENVFFFQNSSRIYFILGIPIWTLVWYDLFMPIFAHKQARRSCFSFEYYSDCSSKLKRKLNTRLRVFMKDTLVKALKINRRGGGGEYFGPPCHG